MEFSGMRALNFCQYPIYQDKLYLAKVHPVGTSSYKFL